MKYIWFTTLFLILQLNPLKAQYGNEWINPSQSYFKIPVTQKGVYRIPQSQLIGAGMPSNVNPQNIQIFHRGQEQAIFVAGEGDGVFNTTDYIDFYGKGNDGATDTELYYPIQSQQVNPYYNLHSDTTAYFVTFRAGTLGKRMNQVNLPNIGYTPENFAFEERINVLAEQLSPGRNFFASTTFAYMSSYDRGEGYTSSPIYSGNRDFLIPIQNAVTASKKPRIEISFVSRNSTNTTLAFQVGASTGSLRTIQNTTVNNYSKGFLSLELEFSDLPSNGNLVVRALNNGGGWFSVTYIRVLYPQALNAGNQTEKEFLLDTNTGATSLVNISNVASGSNLYDITDLNNISQITYTGSGNISAVIPNTNANRRLFLNNTPKNIIGIQSVRFTNINPSEIDYLIVSHPKLMQSAGGYNNVVQAYADYRASVAGGSYKPFVASILQLYDQFNYGEVSPMAIRNFAKYCYNNGSPKFLFLMGYSITLRPFDATYGSIYFTSLDIRSNPSHFALNLVPTWGFPGADVPFTAGFDGTYQYAPSIPTGRLVAQNPQQIANYLNKVKEHEDAFGKGDTWRKNILHLSGGISAGEQATLKFYLDLYKNIAINDFLAASVKTVAKTTNSNVEYVNIADELNDGVAVMTFFGHSGANITDIEIGQCSDDAQGYRNKGKYPMLLGNGCSLGDVYSGKLTQAEDWVFTAERGCIAWLANTSLGFAANLNNYSNRFYSNAFASNAYFGSSIGVINQQVCRSYGASASPNLDLAHFQQMALQGDPAVKLHSGNAPDLYTQNSWLSLEGFNNTPITARADSLQLKVRIANLSKTTNQTFEISVRQTLSNGTIIEHTPEKKFNDPRKQDTLSFTIKRPQGTSFFGNNRIEVQLDWKNEVSETFENNNIGVLEFFIPDFGAKALFPPEYSIVSNQPVKLVAQASNLQLEFRDYVFELDTTNKFNSPAKRSQIVPAGSIATWETALLTDKLPSDSIVYYWRVNYADAVNNPNILWDESSFIYIKNSPSGWSQSHFPQFSKSTDVGIVKNDIQRKWEFQQVQNRIRVTTFGKDSPNAGSGFGNVSCILNDLPLITPSDVDACAVNSLLLVVFDKESKLPIQALGGTSTGVPICGRRPSVVYYFSNTALINGALSSGVLMIPQGSYVLIFNKGNITQAAWDAAKPALLSIGASPAALATLNEGEPYILLTQKGGNRLQEVIATSLTTPTQETVNLDFNLGGGFTKGTVTSTKIGPATNWGTLYKKIQTTELSNSPDVWNLSIIGETSTGMQVVLNSNVPQNQYAYAISSIDANTYPYLRLQLYSRDSINFTPTQLKRWQVIYDGVPEGFLNTERVGLEKYKISPKQEGESFSVPFIFENISGKNFIIDSLSVQYTLLNKTKGTEQIRTFKIKAPKTKEFTEFNVPIQTFDSDGENILRVYVNPKETPEQYYDNNILEVKYDVLRDNKNPILDVTFDGARILDGDIVSPNPLIRIRLRDDNPFLQKKDTVGLDVRLKRPCENCDFEKIAFSNPDIRWRSEGRNIDLEFTPKNLTDGVYTLRVNGEDAKGNRAGIEPYQISFEVITESSVTNVLPYPNPFSGSTRFVFTLTGSEVPQEMKIQILTVSGKVVREITQSELGAIRIGNNISQFAWNGTDEFGDRLANGVYLYRVIMKLNGQEIKHRNTKADKGFKKGYGKLYILR
ncbi:MAG: C25 family cysteine peptidase [Raineya sp.]|nr:C25 family cysteine peptidase [Raineya sp.]